MYHEHVIIEHFQYFESSDLINATLVILFEKYWVEEKKSAKKKE
ncbi:hypothetical protein [Virgibacillus dokdonensis]